MNTTEPCSPMLELALSYAADGFQVFPCCSATKKPLSHHGFHDATTDEAKIRRWWKNKPDAMIGWPTKGFLVLDVDQPQGPNSLKALETEHGPLPKTMTVRTPSGGTHHIYKTEEAVKNSTSGIGVDLDIRGDGGFIILAGSVNVEGRAYETIIDLPATPAPEVLVRMANFRKSGEAKRTKKEASPKPPILPLKDNSRYSEAALQRECVKISTAAEGVRNQTLNEAAFSLGTLVAVGELQEGEVVAALTVAAMVAGLSKEETEKTIRSGIEVGKQSPRQIPKTHYSTTDLGSNPEPGTAPQAIDPVNLLRGFEVNTHYVEKLGKEEFYYPNLIIKRHVITIIAMPGGAKTTFCFFHAAPFLADNGLKVWYIDADSPASDHKRMKELADRHGFKFLNPDCNPGTTMEGLLSTLQQIADAHSELEGWIIFVDTLKKVADLMSKNSVKNFYQLARKLANLGATVVLLGHANKYRDKDGSLVFEGVGDIRADSDELIYFERKSNQNGGIDVTTIINPDKGAKVRGLFKAISFHVSPQREISFYEKPLPVIDRTATAVPKATDDEIVAAAKKYLFSRNEPVVQRQLVQQAADLTGTGVERVRRIIVQNSEPKGSLSLSGHPFVYTIGEKNAHFIELPL